ncbi:MAG: cell division protein FtsI [Nitrospinae bacterium CG11_big_fil_rev_8_21_14_0_20_56_8]|nr:MAG: cell division protein FtsI [Nitrospinae bacterium CG11_big_fil_rev_8_21_14_0_20_56_8]
MTSPKKHLAKTFRTDIRVRLILVSVLFGLFGLGLVSRLFYLQVYMHNELVARSDKQYLSTVKIYYGRGEIFDRNMNQLATNIEVESIFANPADIPNKVIAARELARALNLDPKTVLSRVSSKKHFVWIKRKCSLKEAETVRRLGLSGLSFVPEHKRFYPKRELAAGVVGFVGMDNQGLAGVEHHFHQVLKGTTRLKVMEKDALGRQVGAFNDLSRSQSQSRDLVLTIDEVIQFTAEYHLKKAVEKYRAKSGTAIVMDPSTGEIYALATVPQYNPNQYASYSPKTWKNPGVSNSYEPGSIFKPVVAAAAIDSGVARPQDIFFCENGEFKIGSVSIGEASDHKFGWLTLQNIIAKSSNIGAIKIAQQLGSQNLFRYIRDFGFGQRSGINLPGEAEGQLRSPDRWTQLSLASISFGHEIGVTPLQMITAMSAIANGGKLMQPRITKGVLKEGQPVRSFPPRLIKRVISEKTSKQMIDVLKTVVKEGTGQEAAVEGYDVAGKTGTAQKYNSETQSYSKSDYMSSFVGFAPADAPRLAVLVMIDEPRGTYWGGSVAGPAFREITRQSLRYLGVPSKEERVYILDRA